MPMNSSNVSAAAMQYRRLAAVLVPDEKADGREALHSRKFRKMTCQTQSSHELARLVSGGSDVRY